MLDIKFIKSNVDLVKDAVVKKGCTVNVDRIVGLDEQIRRVRTEWEDLRRNRNELAQSYSRATEESRGALAQQSRENSERIERVEGQLKVLTDEQHGLLLITPNVPDPSAPVGPNSESNVVVKRVGETPKFEFDFLDHVDLVQKNGWANLDKIPQISGSRTFALKGNLVRLELALINFALDVLAKEGFTPITVPPFARDEAFVGTGHFPLGREDAYYLPDEKLYLIGTSEVILNSLHAGDLLEEENLPLLYAGLSPCYRREAGSAGSDVRGLLRVHHFTKVEQFVVCRNDDAESRRWHFQLLGIAEMILSQLELPYQVVECCTGDMGLGKIRMHDVEAWVPSLGTYRETHSCSTLHDWQARRTNTRYRTATKEKRFVHTLNNTAIATPRIFAALLENHQRPNGKVVIPRALRPYMGGVECL